MNTVLKLLRKMDDDDLLRVSEAIDIELNCRLERADAIPESAKRRAASRQSSYRHSTGAAAPLVRFVGLREAPKRRLAA